MFQVTLQPHQYSINRVTWLVGVLIGLVDRGVGGGKHNPVWCVRPFKCTTLSVKIDATFIQRNIVKIIFCAEFATGINS
jgi:hypothetical protein